MAKTKSGRKWAKLLRGATRAADLLGRKRDRTACAEGTKEASVVFRDAEGSVVAEHRTDHGHTILATCTAAGIELDHFCGGQCSCGTCRIIVLSNPGGLSRIEAKEELVLGPAKIREGCRLACQARVCGDVEIQIPRWF